MNEAVTRYSPAALSVMRAVSALLLLQYPLAVFLHFPIAIKSEPMTLGWFAALIELVGAPLLLIGLFTRPVAFLLSGVMAFAYFIGHAPGSLYPIANDGVVSILLCFVFLYLSAAGPGPLSIDALRRADR